MSSWVDQPPPPEKPDDLPIRLPPLPLRVRRSINDLIIDHDQGEPDELDKVIRSWDGIMKLPPDHYNSFFKIAGYHGQPFRGAGWGNSAWWGGYCHHGNVLFPTWHRAMLIRLEDALRTIDGCEDVTLPYWNEVDEYTLLNGVPKIFLEKEYTFKDKTKIKNPLFSYVYQMAISDNLEPMTFADYSKPVGYETVRYPFSGLVGEHDIDETTAYNATLTAKGKEITDKMLNDNVANWLNQNIVNSDGETVLAHTSWKYRHCLRAPNYTVFSNSSSAAEWNEVQYGVKDWDPTSSDSDDDNEPIIPLENPHNDIHLAVGGFNLPGQRNANPVDASKANGDMAENGPAGFDPIFYFHHNFIDKVFWTWQQIHGSTDRLDIIEEYPGTNSTDSQGPTPGVAGNTWLNMKTPLDPFKKRANLPVSDPWKKRHPPYPIDLSKIKDQDYLAKLRGEPNIQLDPMTSEDVINIEFQLGYTYAPQKHRLDLGSGAKKALFDFPEPFSGDPFGKGFPRPQPPQSKIPSGTPILRISGLNRNAISGSFTLNVLDEDGELLGVESVLSRWKVTGCANCQAHLHVKAFIPLLGYKPKGGKKGRVQVKVNARDQSWIGRAHPGQKSRLEPKFRFVNGPASLG